ncbi:MAG TPA: serine/threonine-protein kinase [Gemmataceae bacterium]|nr:serine/threonine-protein kinase [Gemmataceae bacterium]
MTTTTFGACAPFVTQLQETKMVRLEDLSKVSAYVKAFPQRGEAELAKFLVEQKILTQFQADAALEGTARDLVLSQFTLVDILGVGSMGTVYKARSTSRDAWFAIKVVPRRNAVGLGSIAEKVKLLKDIRHPRVSALVHIGAQGERVYLAWPYLEGGERLDQFVQRQGKLTPRQAVQIALQIASGLQAYHQHGLFHGLLKPSDIVIGSDKRVRILDFGVGFLLASERGKSLLDTMTNTRTLARGVDCASPESLMNPLDRTPLGDQYSLGCILYYCLAGRFPFPYENPVKKMLAHQAEKPQNIRELNRDVTPKLAAILEWMTAKKPEDRFASTDEVVQALQALSSPGRVTPHWTSAGAPPVSPSKSAAGKVAATKAASVSNATASSARTEAAEGAWGTNKAVLIGLASGATLGLVAWLLTQL